MFGSGYVLLAFLRTEFVERLHWLTEKQLIDAVAVGQFTPGPLSRRRRLSAMWWQAGERDCGHGWHFPAGFVLVALSGRFSRACEVGSRAAALDGVVAGSLALMAVVAWQLGRSSIVDRTTLVVFAASLVALLRLRLNSALVIAAAAVVDG